MKVELNFSESDIDVIRSAKEDGDNLSVSKLALIGDILLTNLKW